ncbi:carotenoid oxygenase [Pusillimonas sp. TS35]|uniref:carotenoid oxygenase family protein n=1 Tax=Paracandidimonas lactea TaxID=2895524 RepID=UPI00136FEA45|nr:carotenoid oxygenase family protein [Paracandidimonas lactea]MYN12752.1 carotenoid oxygenase [Pusillimonas sp. TS35]
MYEIINTVASSLDPNTDHPFLRGAFQPQFDEVTANTDTMKVIGEIPKDLAGIYIRNTHNQVHEALDIYHPFDGDGMLHAMHFQDGKATYRNRFVRTTGFLAEQAAGKSLWPGILSPQKYTRRGWGSMGAMKDNAGTDVMAHCGKLLASMSQGSEPWRLDPLSLETLGVDGNWAQRVPDGVASHYKVDPATGEMMFFNYPERWPHMHYGVIDKNNQLVHYVPIELPGARWPHDIGVTKNYTILHDLPFFFDPELLKKGQRKITFFPDVPARFGILPRHGDNSTIKWFEGTPCHILHLANSYEDGDEIVMDGCIMPNPHKPAVGQTEGGRQGAYQRIRAHLDKHNNPTHMYRWRFNLRTGQTREEMIDDEITEFPVISNDYVGRPYRYSYNVLYEKGEWLFRGLKRYDMQDRKTQTFEYGPGRYGSEPQIARRIGAKAEDDGYLLTFLNDMNLNRSECLILDASNISAGPVAQIILPHRISAGTHACWVEADRISGEGRDPAYIPG